MKLLRGALRRRLDFLLKMAPHIGIAGVLTLRLADRWNRLARRLLPRWFIRQVEVWPKGYGTSVAIRMGSSDFDVFQQVFVWQQYLPPKSIDDPEIIVDCGANAGYSALFFLKHFPRARVIALEPDPFNAELCRHNLRRYKNRIVVLQKAIWGSLAELNFVDETRKPGEEYGIQVEAKTENAVANTVEGIDIPSLMTTTGVGHIDLLKVDIEKSEADVFRSNPAAWLHRVRNIAIELHGPACTEIFRSALSNFSFLEEQRGEVTFCLEIHPRVNGYLERAK
jgi:FkbM family methyltransferase